MSWRASLSLVCLLPAGPVIACAADAKADKVSFAEQIVPLVSRYCTDCHHGEKAKAHLALDQWKNEAAARKDTQTWEKILHKLQAREMPPKKKPQPNTDEMATLLRWIEGDVLAVDCTLNKKDPGRITIRRLNRVEYNNTIRDLVGVKFQPADDFPADDVGYGFDNIGDVLSMPPILLEKYLAAAEKIVAAAFKDPELRKRIVLQEPAADNKNRRETTRKILENFARRAWRRPVTAEELQRLGGFVRQAFERGDNYDRGIQLACTAVLVSPNFLFRIEADFEPSNPNAIRPINEFELATRLSYFLWSTLPDDELFELAGKAQLRKNLDAQVRRMLRDPKACELTENFAGQWLQLRSLANMTPDPGRFPNFDEPLRSAMRTETEMFFEAIVRDDRSILDFIDADFTFVNERLAKHYGIPGVKGDQFRKVKLPDRNRGGVLTQGSVLLVTSNPTRTSPVKRGKWILENLLNAPPPPPPPDVPELKEGPELKGSLRERMEQHRVNPTCAVCHDKMDPLGFGFENFDAIGAWRTKDAGYPIDPSGVLPDGRSFQGPAELKAILKSQKDQFARCLAEKLLTYALGRGVEYYDRCTLDQIVHGVAKNDYRFTALVLEIVKSEAFQYRRGKK